MKKKTTKKGSKKVPKAPEYLYYGRDAVEEERDVITYDSYVRPEMMLEHCGCNGDCDCGCPVAVYKFVGYGKVERPPAALVMDK